MLPLCTTTAALALSEREEILGGKTQTPQVPHIPEVLAW
jgi:hypothetical protein